MTNGIWDQFTANKYHQSSPLLAYGLSNLLTRKSTVIDFGCGNGFYLNYLAKKGYLCVGVEGYPLNNFLHDDIQIKDLTTSFDLGLKGNVISLEVGEHLPKSAEQTYLDTITRHCNDILVLSWALPNQPGIGHINCQPQEYIKKEVTRRGFTFDDIYTELMRESIDDNTDWFRRTLLVFTR